jgi:hypothetical protein
MTLALVELNEPVDREQQMLLRHLALERKIVRQSARRLCKHCRWARTTWDGIPAALLFPFLWWEFWQLATCRHPTSIDPPLRDYVSGKPLKPRRLSCNVARAANYRDRCGPQARYWEPRR